MQPNLRELYVFYKMGVAGLFVDAKHEQAKVYCNQFAFISMPDQLNNLFLLLATLAKSLGSSDEND
jgi:hypothetical protein